MVLVETISTPGRAEHDIFDDGDGVIAHVAEQNNGEHLSTNQILFKLSCD